MIGDEWLEKGRIIKQDDGSRHFLSLRNGSIIMACDGSTSCPSSWALFFRSGRLGECTSARLWKRLKYTCRLGSWESAQQYNYSPSWPAIDLIPRLGNIILVRIWCSIVLIDRFRYRWSYFRMLLYNVAFLMWKSRMYGEAAYGQILSKSPSRSSQVLDPRYFASRNASTPGEFNSPSWSFSAELWVLLILCFLFFFFWCFLQDSSHALIYFSHRSIPRLSIIDPCLACVHNLSSGWWHPPQNRSWSWSY